MAKKDSIAQYKDRIRNQVARAHVEDEPSQPKKATPSPKTPKAPQKIEQPAQTAPKPTRQARTRSKWRNPYPQAEPVQLSVYLTEEDIILIKQLRLKLHFAREWMVIKYALEKLNKDLDKSKTMLKLPLED